MSKQKLIVHEKTFDIEWGDMDALGHVNNGRYFDYFQQARIEWLQNLTIDMKQKTGPVVVHIAATFLKPVVYPATLTIKSYLHTPGRSSFQIEHELFQDQELMTQCNSKIVWVDYTINKAIPYPEAIKRLLAP